ncbi:hypothetical protein QBC41DRAFT_354203 [Cercophora samala]|uniref:Uncharacterized protein n=1 Tax=Cercophora samala TaxID=330535 RepID=A0AA39ZIN1_9PEZI|nr:hypothetical protein QBC41DRAFT_354203 [Cercophora samala]
MPLSNIQWIFGGLHSWPARRLHCTSTPQIFQRVRSLHAAVVGNAARKLMRLLSQKANDIHVNFSLGPISALASWRSGSLCLGMKRKRASMNSAPCKSAHPPLILHFSLKALLGLPTPTEMPSIINRRPAQEPWRKLFWFSIIRQCSCRE